MGNKSEEKYFLIWVYGEKATIININPYNLRRVHQAKSYQEKAFPGDVHKITTRTGKDLFKCIKTGLTYKAGKGAYLQEVRDKFLNSYE